jgi:enoyl-CoA hydratase/carnithine racemase
MARDLAQGPREAFALGKKAFNQAAYPNLKEVLAYEGILQEEASKAAAHRRRVNQFFERRKKS